MRVFFVIVISYKQAMNKQKRNEVNSKKDKKHSFFGVTFYQKYQ